MGSTRVRLLEHGREHDDRPRDRGRRLAGLTANLWRRRLQLAKVARAKWPSQGKRDETSFKKGNDRHGKHHAKGDMGVWQRPSSAAF